MAEDPTPDEPAPLVRLRGVRMAFGGVEVVKGVDLDLMPGEVHAILGENGAGKSTVAKIAAGVYRPTAGTVEIGGREVRLEGPRHAIEQGIALIHQEPLTFPDLDVAENIFVGHQPKRGLLGVDWKAMHARADEILRSLGVRMNSRAKVGSLSVADQQMVELASALSHDARVLILDETTAALTPKEVAELFAIVRRLREGGHAIAFVSHRLGEVFEIADRITVMRDGEKVGELVPARSSIEEVVRLMVGRDLTGARLQEARTPSVEPVLEVHGLSSGSRVKDVSLSVRPGEIVGLAGLVGAGRTELAQAIFGIDRRTAGRIVIDGKEVRIRGPRDAMAQGLALVPEDRQHDGLLMPMTISENSSLASLRSLASFGWLRDRREKDAAGELAQKMRLAHRSLDQPVRELSGGNQQKVVLAKWLQTRPKVLILDEPTRGVDIGAKEEVHRLMRELVDGGLGILMISSDLPEVLDMSDRVLVMREGRLVAELPRAEADSERIMFAATGEAGAAV